MLSKRCKAFLSRSCYLMCAIISLILTRLILRSMCIDRFRDEILIYNFNLDNHTIRDHHTIIPSKKEHDSQLMPLSSSELSSFIDELPVNNEIECDKFQQTETLPDSFKSYFTKKQEVSEHFNYANCTQLQRQGFLLPIPIAEKELNHPIAFSLLVYKDVTQVTRLIRAIYRPHNVYCIHVDLKSSDEFFYKINQLSNCLQNVFIFEKRLDVKWSKFTVLKPELLCMQALLRHGVKWKTWINLTGQEFPLKTNLELVNVLEVMKGTNDVRLDNCTYGGPEVNTNEDCKRTTKNGWMERWPKNAGPPPYGILPYKGSVHVILSRDFVHFLMTSEPAQAFLRWLESGMRVPDEFFFPTINYNLHLHAPGSSHHATILKPNIARLKFWRRAQHKSCLKFVRYICIFSLQELPILTSSTYMFANKFFQNFSPLGYSCLERWYFKRVYKELISRKIDLDLEYYRQIFSRD